MMPSNLSFLFVISLLVSPAALSQSFESHLKSLQDQNLISPTVNISSFYKWREGRQESLANDDEGSQDEASKNPFLQWIQSIFGITTTTPSPPLTPPTDCGKCSCGKINNKRIVGGSETGINQYPWMAMLMYSGRFYCGATLINDRYVMASHCVHGFNPDRISVLLLEHDRTSATESETIKRGVKRVVKHPRYSQTNYDNDIALVQLDSPVDFKGILNPVCLPTPKKNFAGDDGIVIGWGTLKEGGDVSNTLQEVTVPILTNRACKQTGYSPLRITDNMLCAGYPEGSKDSCQGDSGGPLQVISETSKRYQIAGVVSWGDGCAKKNYPGVYARVNRYGTWIGENTLDSCKCSEEE